jgi:soluble lytic murein transglycosylase-like protein
MFNRFSIIAVVTAPLLAIPLFARESVCLATGFCLTADSHVQRGSVYVLRTGTGTMEFPANQIAEIISLPDLPNANPLANQNPPAASFDEMLVRAALRQGLDPEFVRSVARIESDLRQDAVSNKGAIGLMQLMPGTAAVLGVDAHNPEDNVLGGAKFLRELLLRYNGDPALALAAYNAGPGAVQKYNGVPPYLETRKYILRVLREYKKQQDAEKSKVTAKTPNATN